MKPITTHTPTMKTLTIGNRFVKQMTPLLLLLILMSSNAFSQTTSTGSVLLGDYDLFSCNGVYGENADYLREIEQLDGKNFIIEFDFFTQEYRDQWPLILGKYYRVFGLKLNRNKSMALTLNNQRKNIDLDYPYETEKWYNVKMSYNRGHIQVIINNVLVTETTAALSAKWPNRDYIISSCNYSNSTCFKGYLRNVIVF